MPPQSPLLDKYLAVSKQNIALAIIGVLAWAWVIYWTLVFATGTTSIFKSVL